MGGCRGEGYGSDTREYGCMARGIRRAMGNPPANVEDSGRFTATRARGPARSPARGLVGAGSRAFGVETCRG